MRRKDQPDIRRHALAFAVAPFVAAGMWAVTAFVWLAWVDGVAAARADVPTLIVGTPFIALPISVGLVLFVAGPLYSILAVTTTLTRRKALAAGVAIGVGVSYAGQRIMNGLSMINGMTGAIIGLTTAWVWWVVAEGRRSA